MLFNILKSEADMKRKLSGIYLMSLLLFFLLLSSCKHKDRQHHNENAQEHLSETIYTCPMHPEVISNQPGICPKCKMKLEPLVNKNLPQIISPNKQVLSRQVTVKLLSGSDGKTMKAQGYIVPAQNHNRSVAARFSGRIEKLYVKFSNQSVQKGDKIMDIYSPQLRTFQEEHVFLYKLNTDKALIQKSREKLRLLGITESQLSQLEKNGTVALIVSVYSPVNGYVFFDAQSIQENAKSKNSSAMNAMSMNQKTNNENTYAASTSQMREGTYVNEGQTLFNVNDLQEVWALVSVTNQNANQIQENHSVEIISENNPSKVFNGKVALVEQTFEEANQRFARVRIVLRNTNNSLKINSLVTAHFTLSNNGNLQVPSTAVYKTGLNAYVWVKTDTTLSGTGIFQVRKVIIVPGNNGLTTIKSGLSSDEEVALQAGLMIDSETFLNEN